MAYMDNCVLYYKKTCPYCHKVMDYMSAAGITMDLRDIAQPGNVDDLVRIGGMKQVPCLVHNGQALYESADIIEWLRNNAAK
ncbi:MAG: glutaredoxin [Eggerthellaceae bacterium]|nr:glutaredoxin [Eggerthellaceae bacterium]